MPHVSVNVMHEITYGGTRQWSQSARMTITLTGTLKVGGLYGKIGNSKNYLMIV